MPPNKPIIGITTGDPAGIGPEIIEKALLSPLLPDAFEYRILGDTDSNILPGKPSPESAALALGALDESVRLLKKQEIAAVVTGPVSKETLRLTGFPFPGQTEFFADRFGVDDFAMILTGGPLTVALATIHIPLRDVPTKLDALGIARAARHLLSFTRRRYPGKEVRLAVAGLNPHAGEHGLFGDEEARVIEPALRELEQHHPGVFSGPHSPDAVFRRAAQGEFDGVVCMYHDQGLIPLKLIGFETGVNVTWGLHVIRTSPDHGTAFEIAGRGIADPSSMIAAIRLAAELVRTRD